MSDTTESSTKKEKPTLLDLAEDIYNFDRLREDAVKDKIFLRIRDDSMGPFYSSFCEKFDLPVDESMLKSLQEKNEKSLETIEAKLQDNIVNAGDMEVLDSLFSKARHYTTIGDWNNAYKIYDEILNKEKTPTGKKIDANMEKARIALFNVESEKEKAKDIINEAKRLNDIGGDWDRRNRLKVYEAMYLMVTRDIQSASKLLLECVATFTCVELCSYKQFMLYTLLISIVCMKRSDLKKKIIDDPHVINVTRELPNAKILVHAIYNCDYQRFFEGILLVHPEIMSNRFLGPLCVYLVREYRVLAYSQFLEAYKSVMFSSMAVSFGISTNLLDAELSRFIAAGRLHAKIDKVGDIIETSRPDKKNAQYQEVIKKGDLLLNQIQKLVRVVNL